MPPTITPGTRVRTKNCGEGSVREVQQKGVLVEVLGFSLLVPFGEFEVVGGLTRPIRANAKAPRKVGSGSATAGARAPWLRAIEALRFGIVPEEAIERLSVGYDALRDWVHGQLPDVHGGRCRIVEVVGPFGTGKSHTLAVIRQIAQAQGYLTLHAEIDGSAVSLADPAALLYSLMRTLKLAEDTIAPVVELTKRASGRGHQQALFRLSPFQKVSDNYATAVALRGIGKLDEFEEQLDLLMAGSDAFTAPQLRAAIHRELEPHERAGITPTRLVSISVGERPADFAHALGGYARLAERAGFKGLVITLDEFEVETHWERVGATITGLMIELLMRPAAQSAPLAMFVGVVPSDGADGDPFLDMVVTKTSGEKKVLRAWSGGQLKLLAKRVHATYCQAYELKAQFDDAVFERTREGIQSADEDLAGHVRTFLKRYIAALDSVQGPPANPV